MNAGFLKLSTSHKGDKIVARNRIFSSIAKFGIFLAAVAALSLGGCSGGDEGSGSAGATGVSAANVIGTWKLVTIDSVDVSSYEISLVADASTYTLVLPVSFSGQTACTEYGTWSVSGSTLTTTPIAGSTCGSSPSNATVSVSGSTMTTVSADGTWVYQKQTSNSVSGTALVGTWKMMATDTAGTVTPTYASSYTLIINNSTYSFSAPNCSEAGTWSVSGSTVSISPSAGSTCNASTYTRSASLNNSLLTLMGTEVQVWQKQAGASNAAPASAIAAGAAGGVNINWQLVSGATSYNIYRGTASGTLATKILVGTVTSSTYRDATAVAGVTYYYQITSVSSNGESSPSSEVSGTATASVSLVPSPVTGLTAIPGDTQVSLSWNAVSGAISYKIYSVHTPAGSIVPVFAKLLTTSPASYPTSSWGLVPGATITSPSARILGLVNGDTYQYMVTAVNANGEGLSTYYVEAKPVAQAAVWTSRTSGTSANLYDISYNGVQYLAVGGGLIHNSFTSADTAVVLTSPDGATWTQAASGGPALSQVIWCSTLSKYVAVGYGGTVYTSPDGLAWTPQNSGTANSLYGITWSSALSTFVAVGDNGTLITSSDGTTWTTRTSGTAQNLRRVVRLGGKFVAVGWSGTILTSADGISWAAQTSGTVQQLMDIANNGSMFVAVGGTGTILTSADAVTWTARTSGVTDPIFNVGWDGSKFVSGVAGMLLTSPDGVTWNNQTISTTNTNWLWSIGGSASRIVLVGEAGTIMTLP